MCAGWWEPMAHVEATILVTEPSERFQIAGSGERNLKMVREALGVSVTARNGMIHLRGDQRAVVIARRVLEHLGAAAEPASRQQVLDVIAREASRLDTGGPGWGTRESRSLGDGPAWEGDLQVFANGRAIGPKTPNQAAYLEAIRTNDLVFGIGPAGTGKTYLAVAAAVHLLRSERVRKLILARPAVEAGERLGFLPGDLQAKVNPYLRPLFDALHDLMDYGTIRRFMDTDVVEVVPLAFMRGRTLNNAVIILDEAQNTTRGQMMMFLTRMGHGSKTIVTGDTTQIDLPDPRESGLIDAARRLVRIPGIGFVTLDRSDVVRHNLVQRIVDAYGDESTREPANL